MKARRALRLSVGLLAVAGLVSGYWVYWRAGQQTERRAALAQVRAHVSSWELSRESAYYVSVEIAFENAGPRAVTVNRYAIAWPGGRQDVTLGRGFMQSGPLSLEPGQRRRATHRVYSQIDELDRLTASSFKVTVAGE